jgi:hypothetical protein
MLRQYNKEEIKKIITIFIPALIILAIGLLMMTSCAGIKEIPVQTVEKVVYRDSLIYINDTLRVEVPKEVVKEIIQQIDTSYLKTSLAESVAYLDTTERKLHHTLTQKGEVTIKYDTIVKIQYVDRIVEKEVPVEVEVIKYKRDTFFWVLLGWAALCVGYALLNFFIRKYLK